MSRRDRLRKRREYLSLYRSPEAIVHTAHFVAYVRANGLRRSRLGLTVSKKVAAPARRNRLKRRLREIFRRCRKDFVPSVDIVINAKRAAAQADFSRLRESFAAVAPRLERAEWKEE